MSINLTTILNRLGLSKKPRFTVEETAEILGIRRDQVMDLLKRGKLIGVKSSASRWSGIFAEELNEYVEVINGTRVRATLSTTQGNGVVQGSQVLVPPPLFEVAVISEVPTAMSDEHREAEAFVRRLEFLPTLANADRRIYMKDLVAFYARLTNQEGSESAPVFLGVLSKAIEAGDIEVQEEFDYTACQTVFVGIDLPLLSAYFAAEDEHPVF